MTILDRLHKLVQDPPPAHAFEIAADGIAWSVQGRTGWDRLPNGILQINPLTDNVLDADALAAEVRRLAPAPPNSKKRRPCALILPDYCSRLTILDFDSLPSKPEEQASLVRFRMKKSLPFDADSAALSFHVQSAGGNQREVIVAAVSLEILSRYEAAFRTSGFQPGFVTISTLAMLDLVDSSTEMTLIAKLNGKALTLAVMHQGALKLLRCVELAEISTEEVAAVVMPTLAFVEDQHGQPVSRVLTCGFEEMPGLWPDDLKIEALAAPASSAGLMGYLRALSN